MTAKFLKDVNDAFNVLNVRAFGAKAAGPLRVSSCEQRKQLVRIQKRLPPGKWHIPLATGGRPPCFNGLRQDFNMVLQRRECSVVDGPLLC